MDKTIPELLATLREGKITEELYNIILSIAKSKKGHEKGQGIGHNDEAEGVALEFILYLKGNLGIGDIESKSALRREFDRWITKTNAGEDHELWTILSEALLVLEKEGICERGQEFKKYNNNNNTIWCLPKLADSKPDLSENNLLICAIPSYRPVKRSIDAKNRAKIIPPSSAQELVKHILTAVGGPIKMGDILHIAKDKVVLTKVISISQNENEEEKNETDSVPDRKVAFELFIQEEVDNRVNLIWSEVATIERGRQEKVQGHQILCLYIIPYEIGNKTINMEEFGPSSTVDNVKSDVFKVLKEYLSFEPMLDNFDEGMLPAGTIKIKIIQEINKKCSENGYDTGLDTVEDGEEVSSELTNR